MSVVNNSQALQTYGAVVLLITYLCYLGIKILNDKVSVFRNIYLTALKEYYAHCDIQKIPDKFTTTT